jgi:hypothetical protein
MHYIPGTTITASARPRDAILPGMTSNQLRQAATNRTTNAQATKLQPGIVYTLSRVFRKPGDDNITYRFTCRDEPVDLQFDSTATADKMISQLRGENTPDYNQINQTKTD